MDVITTLTMLLDEVGGKVTLEMVSGNPHATLKWIRDSNYLDCSIGMDYLKAYQGEALRDFVAAVKKAYRLTH